jgi:phosphoribosylformylglycinamidine synthase
MPFDQQILEELAISESEYEMIIDKLDREPNKLELGLFGSLWSEHCGYKHSKPLLGAFRSDSPRLLVKAGEENAGVVDIGEGLAVVFKIESHNHPSAIEPYQGAATGVGGIVRDIFAMGARPIALLNSLRFGPIKENQNRYLFDGVVDGISGYGNCIGVPNVGGEVNFDKSYSSNPLVNAMCIGLLKTEQLIRATAGEVGNLLVLVGSGTGRDGIHGASGLASRTFEDDRELRPTVQVGNPFLEKVLIEACLEAHQSHQT